MFLLFDIGGTKMRFAFSEDGTTLSEVKMFPTPQEWSEAKRVFEEVLRESEGKVIEKVAGGLPGEFDEAKSHLVWAPHLKQWVGVPIQEELEAICNASVVLENDATLGGLGEATSGVGKDIDILAYVTVGTGVGGARIVNKKIDTNAHGFEVGHQVIQAEGGPFCACGGTGHLEAYVSGSALQARFNKLPSTITDPAVWDEVAQHLAVGLANVALLWSPNAIVLGGSVVTQALLPLEKIEAYLHPLLPMYETPPPIRKATLGDSGGLYGALALLSA